MKHSSACITILVGKKASIDGSVVISRNDDMVGAITPQKSIIEPVAHGEKGRKIKSWLNKFEMDLPKDAQRVSIVPNVSYKKLGCYDESGISQKNVAMSCTESTYGNEGTLAFDPLVKDDLNENCMRTVVLSYIDSARDGVKRLDILIKKYGSPARNSVLFGDKGGIRYMEIITDHHWVIQCIPDDCYAATGNRVAIRQINFDDPGNFMWSERIQEFVEKHHLNSDHEGWNFRHTFGTYTEQDRHYNTSRQWYIQRLFNPEIEQDPEDPDIPFIRKASKKLAKEDIEFALGSHYQDMPLGPLGHRTEEEKHRYRPTGLNRTQSSHILQTGSDVPEEMAGIMWLCIGGLTLAPYIPFFANMNETNLSFNSTPMTYNKEDAWRYYKSLVALVESCYPQFIQLDTKHPEELNRYYRDRVEEIIENVQGLNGEKLTDYLTRENQKVVTHTKKDNEESMGQMFTDAIKVSKLTFKMDPNL